MMADMTEGEAGGGGVGGEVSALHFLRSEIETERWSTPPDFCRRLCSGMVGGGVQNVGFAP